MSIQSEILENIKQNILFKEDYNFTTDHDDNLTLQSKVVIYNTGSSWKIIPLNVCLSYPIIYDTYSGENTTHDITFVFCPITLRTIYLKGIFTVLNYTDDYTMVLQESSENKSTNDSIIPIDIGSKINSKYVVVPNKRTEVKITTLRNALIIVPDALFLTTKKEIKLILSKKYYFDMFDLNMTLMDGLIHPKTLVYIIQYTQKNSNKISIIIGKDVVKSEVTGYDSKQSEIFEYLDHYKDKIISLNGFVMPVLWYIAKKSYPTAHVIYVQR